MKGSTTHTGQTASLYNSKTVGGAPVDFASSNGSRARRLYSHFSVVDDVGQNLTLVRVLHCGPLEDDHVAQNAMNTQVQLGH